MNGARVFQYHFHQKSWQGYIQWDLIGIIWGWYGQKWKLIIGYWYYPTGNTYKYVLLDNWIIGILTYKYPKKLVLSMTICMLSHMDDSGILMDQYGSTNPFEARIRVASVRVMAARELERWTRHGMGHVPRYCGTGIKYLPCMEYWEISWRLY